MTPTERAAVAPALAEDEIRRYRKALARCRDHIVDFHYPLLDRDEALIDFIGETLVPDELSESSPAPADQSDAGLDGVIAECAKIVDKTSQKFGQNSSSAIAIRKAAADMRALANTPSETVGRGDEGKESFLSKWTKVINATPLNLKRGEPLPTADRDAIREALVELVAAYDDMSRTMSVTLLTAALGLLGEG